MKKGIGKVLAFALSILMVMTLVPGMVFAEDATYTVYVSATGDDTNTGESNSPVATLSQAYTLLKTKMTDAPSGSEGTVVISGTIEQSTDLPTFTSYPVTITGATPQDGINVTINATTIYVGGPTTFKNITLTHNGKNSNYMLNLGGKGYPITIDEGVTVVPKKHKTEDRYYYMNLLGGAYGASLATGNTSTNLTVKSGSWRGIIGGSITSNSTVRNVSGNVTVNMTGGTVVPAVIEGDGDICGSVGTVGGKITINIGGDAVVNRPVKDLRVSSYYTIAADTYGSCEINLTGGQVKAGVVRNNAEGSFAANIDLTGGTPLLLGGTNVMTNLTGGGRLSLRDTANVEFTGTVSGKTEVYVEGEPQLKTYIVTPLGVSEDAFDYTDSQGVANARLESAESEGKLNWSVAGYEVIVNFYNPYADTGFKMGSVYKGYDSIAANEITPEEDGTYILGAGSYSYYMDGGDRQKAFKLFLVDMDDIRAGEMTITLPDTGVSNTSPTTEKGYSPSSLTTQILNDEALETLYTLDNLVHYEDILDENGNIPIPSQTIPGHPYCKGTTQSQLVEYLDELAAEEENMYVFYLEKSPYYNHWIPLVVFTKEEFEYENSWEGLDRAVAAIEQGGKPTFGVCGQIHGNETSAAEGSLLMIHELTEEYGDMALDTINAFVIPRLNADGAKDCRNPNWIPNINMNRDNTIMESSEIRFFHKVFLKFMPVMFADMHENQGAIIDEENDVFTFTDDQRFSFSGPGYHIDDATYAAQTESFVRYIHETCGEEGIRAYPFAEIYASRDLGLTNRTYAENRACAYSATLESNKNHEWTTGNLKRRIYVQYYTIKTMMDYLLNNTDEVVDNVMAAREYLSTEFATYDENNLMTLSSSVNRDGYSFTLPRNKYDLYGNVIGRQDSKSYIVSRNVLRSRPYATAYVLPKGVGWVEDVVERLSEGHGLTYEELPPGTELDLRQYYITDGVETPDNSDDDNEDAGADEEGEVVATSSIIAEIKETETVVFEDGAYYFPMTQDGSYVLAGVLEPDVNALKENRGTFVQRGLIPINSDKTVPLYRSEATINIYDVTISGENAVISVPATSTGAPVNFTVTPKLGYYITGITIGGTPFTGFDAYAGGTYGTGEITANTEIVVTTAPIAESSIEGVSNEVATLPAVFAPAADSAVTFGKVLDNSVTEWGIKLTKSGENVISPSGVGPMFPATNKNANGQFAVEFVGLETGTYMAQSYVKIGGEYSYGIATTIVVE